MIFLLFPRIYIDSRKSHIVEKSDEIARNLNGRDIKFIEETLDFYSKNKNIINELAVEGKRIFDEYRNSLNSVLLRYKLKESVVDYILMPTLIRAFQEFYLSKVYKEMLIDFNRNLLKILNAGYLPCGWKYSFAQEDQSYNPLTYIEESLEENLNGFEKSFNYSAGSLYLF